MANNHGQKQHLESVIIFGECRRNYTASNGGYVLDGCGEFMRSLQNEYLCAACFCHRNHHRREEIYVLLNSDVHESLTRTREPIPCLRMPDLPIIPQLNPAPVPEDEAEEEISDGEVV